MFLKSLTIKGFKSFADSTTLEFEPGVTVVVGPNGSGKSNVVDAVAWVLGAQGPRTLRSGKMEDVIFAGTPKRPPLGRAEVSLTIDNSAGLLPIDFSEVTITRTLFRSGDSEYSINGVPCRLLEIQELLSDTGVGRQQHVIVSQGNIDSVLNARPEERRFVVEEAAGILKYRRRKEKAERRLESTEAGLVRLQDLLREVRRQLRPLEKQADAARRHGDVVSELARVQRYLHGLDLASVEARLRSAAREKDELHRRESETRRSLGVLDAEVITAEGALEALVTATGGPRAAEVQSRAEAGLARALGVGAVLAERRRSLERERAVAIEAGVVARLEAEAATLGVQLTDTDHEAASLLPQADALAAAETQLSHDEADFETRWAAWPRQLAGDAVGEVRAELAALRATSELSLAERARISTRLDALAERLARLQEESAGLADALAQASGAEDGLVADLESASGSESSRHDALRAAEDALRRSDGERNRWSARAEALESALALARARAGAARLADVSGVLGTLLDLVEVVPGYELAFEAAAGEVLAGVVVDGPESARRALEVLGSSAAAGAVVPLEIHTSTEQPRGGPLPALVDGGGLLEPLRGRVRARLHPVEALLDGVLSKAVVVDGGWERALDVAIADPTLVVVTRDGDRFASGVWRTRAGGDGATGAALEEARTRAASASRSSDLAAGSLERVRVLAEDARSARASAERVLEANAASTRRLDEQLNRIGEELSDVGRERASLRTQRDDIDLRLRLDGERLADLESLLADVEVQASIDADRASAERTERSELARRTSELATARHELELRAAGLEERRTFTRRRLDDVEDHLARSSVERGRAQARRTAAERALLVVSSLADLVGQRSAALRRSVSELRQATEAESSAERTRAAGLETLRRRRASTERELTEIRELTSRAEIDEAEARVRMEGIVESIRRDLDCEPDAVRNSELPPLPPGTSATSRRVELEREIRLMGPINPLALEEHEALLERNRFLDTQLEDVRKARRELTKVIKAVDDEIVELFQAAYADVAEHFERLFSTLFPGGEGRLRLTDPEHPLDTGIEMEARPSGKNLRRLSLLSGGERSLAAMAFLFAVFRARPSPFYMLDEVEAALDDVNLHRFLDLVHEFRDEAQLLIVSHQKRTMEAADCLYGVTMAPGGSSKVVSERVRVGPDAAADAPIGGVATSVQASVV